MTSGVQPKYVKGIDQMRMPAEAKRLAEQTLKEMQGVDPREFMGTMPEKIDPIPFVPAECRYEIGGRVYIQRKPKLMQQRQLLNVLKQSDIDFGNLQIEPSRA
ncbi:hypothetical protein KKF61_09020, partial [Patescibacteria group bacterium]|nr:hypothetical protein [Patescibacteria group bacterium]